MIRTMEELPIRFWLEKLLVNEAGFDRAEAAHAVAALSAAPDWNPRRVLNLATGLLASPRLPGGKEWWDGEEGRKWKGWLLEGRGPDLHQQMAEIVSPAPDCWNINWPEHKRFRVVDPPEGSALGDMFIVGDGEGRRGLFRVTDRDGHLGAVLYYTWDPLEDEENRALAQAEPHLGYLKPKP